MFCTPVAKTSELGLVMHSISKMRSRRFSQVANSGGKVDKHLFPLTFNILNSGMNEMDRISPMLLLEMSKISNFLSRLIVDGNVVNRLFDRNNSYK